MGQSYNYTTNRETKFSPLEKFDVQEIVAACTVDWFNQALTEVDDSIIRLGIVQGEYHWHKHEQEDEFFFVLSGQLLVDLEDRSITLNAQEGVTIPKGVVHRTRANEKTVVLMVEKNTAEPTGD